jgi:hypothetical protein
VQVLIVEDEGDGEAAFEAAGEPSTNSGYANAAEEEDDGALRARSGTMPAPAVC